MFYTGITLFQEEEEEPAAPILVYISADGKAVLIIFFNKKASMKLRLQLVTKHKISERL